MYGIAVLLACFIFHVNCASLPNDIQVNAKETTEISTNSIDVIETSKPNVCTTDGCVREAKLMINSIDNDVSPCDDFYDFACGRWIRETVLPDDKALVMSFTQVQDKVEEQIRQVLSEAPNVNESKPFKLAKMFHAACMDEAALNEKGITPMVEILESYGGWPVVKGDLWDSNNWNWMETLKKIANDGISDSLIYTFNVIVDYKNSSKRTIAIDHPSFGLAGKFLVKGMDDPNVKAYYDYMVDAAVLFGADKSTAELELLDVLQFETNLATISMPPEARRNLSALYNPYTIQQLQTTYPYINWLDFVNWNLRGVLTVDENEIVVVLDQDYLLLIENILKSTSKRTVANYLAWRSVKITSTLLNDVFHQRYQDFLAKTTGTLKSDPRQVECVKKTMSYLSISGGASYVRKYFNEESKKAATSLVDSISKEFVKTLQNVPWMDDVTRSLAMEKADKVTFHIGYPDELIQENKLEEYYKDLDLSDSLLHNVLRVTSFRDKHYISKLHEPVNKTDWESHSMPTVVNAFYSLIENSIQLPAAVLQDRFFSVDRPSYMNYAYIGWFIGHEITHGFDDEGRQFDVNGNLVDWWQEDTATKFKTRAKCIIDQYSNYTKPGTNLRVNGVNTQGENIADNGAVKGMYSAYQNFVEQNGPEPTLPGLNYTPNQLFWISAAQLWCAATRPEFDTVQYTTDVHAPNKHRIIGTFSNMETFSRDFNCPIGSNMNPAKKCEVW